MEILVDNVPVYLNHSESVLHHLLYQLQERGSLHVLCDENTVKYCLPKLQLHNICTNEPLVMPAGEWNKNLSTCETIWNQLIMQGADRSSSVVMIGGGVVTDLGGFCAATFLRGINFLHIPTSLLAMCDAAIGGKHGVDFAGLKNYIGVFAHPQLVWIDTGFLTTLPERHLRNGMAEIVKHAVIADPQLFTLLEQEDTEIITDCKVLQSAISVKKKFVENDFREAGKRATLNFGHTFGHAIESLKMDTLLHGECVALGMIMETWLSHLLKGTPTFEECTRIQSLIRKHTPVEIHGQISLQSLIPLVLRDKKQRHHKPHFVFLSSIGAAEWNVGVDPENFKVLRESPKIAESIPWLTD